MGKAVAYRATFCRADVMRVTIRWQAPVMVAAKSLASNAKANVAHLQGTGLVGGDQDTRAHTHTHNTRLTLDKTNGITV